MTFLSRGKVCYVVEGAYSVFLSSCYLIISSVAMLRDSRVGKYHDGNVLEVCKALNMTRMNVQEDAAKRRGVGVMVQIE